MSTANSSSLAGFDALDACHRQIHEHLTALGALAQRIATQGLDAQAQEQAGAI